MTKITNLNQTKLHMYNTGAVGLLLLADIHVMVINVILGATGNQPIQSFR